MGVKSRPTSVVHVCSATHAVYGAVQSLLTLARAQRQAGFRVEFVTFAGKAFGSEVAREGFRVHQVAVRAKIDPLAIIAMRRLFCAEAFDIVHTHLSTSSVNGTLGARTARVPSVATVHGMSGKLSFLFADHLIGVSAGVKAHLIQQGVSPSKISVVYNGLPMEIQKFDRVEVRRSIGVPQTGVVVGTISRVTAKKGIDDALRAIAALTPTHPNLQYLVVGSGDGVDPAKKLAAELEIAPRVHFVGYRNDVDFCLAAMDLFLFPTHKEAMGIALVEAMRSRLPIIASNTGGVPEVVTPECGRLVGVGDFQAIAARLSELLKDPEEMTRMGENGRRRAEANFSDLAMREATDAVYELTIQNSVRRA